MIRFLVKTCYFAILAFIISAGIVVLLTSTTPGLQAIVNLGQLYLPGSLKIQKIKGSLLNDFTLEGISYQQQNLRINLSQLYVQWHPKALKKHVLHARWSGLQGTSVEQKFSSANGTITATATLPELALNLNSNIGLPNNGHWQMNASLLGLFPWKWTLDGDLSERMITAKQAGFHSNISLHAMTKSNTEGNLLLTIHPGYYQIPDNSSLPAISFKGGKINLDLSPQGLTGNGALTIDPDKALKMQLRLPEFALNSGLKPNQNLNADLSLQINSLDFLQNISPALTQLKGQLIASLKAHGTLDKPQIESQILLNKTSFYLPQLQLHIDESNLQINAKEKHWDASGVLSSAGHNLSLKGRGTIDKNYVGDLFLEGNDFPVIKNAEYQIWVSPKLQLHLTPEAQVITGSIVVPQALIKQQSFSNSISLSEDIVYKKQQEQPVSTPLNSSMDINIAMGDKVELNVKGLKGHVAGQLNIKQQPQGAINAYGELSVVDGTYKAYGQDLAITQGQLIFTGGPINNPGISLRAAKKINNTANYTNASQLFDFNSSNLQSVNLGDTITLGVQVTGRLTRPKVQLFSDPAILSQADILSMLVLGRPASQANKAGGQLLLAAISSMNIGGTNSTQLLEQLKQSSGLDFNVQTNTNYNQLTNTVSDSTAFVVGKSLSKRLYLSYNIGISQTDTNILTLKYMLNKFFSIQVSNSDTSSAIDFLYTSQKRKHIQDQRP
jgi:translocation and assembly module TamB